jgi:hypothetical protein
MAMISLVTVFLTQSPAQAADTTPDIVGNAWRARAAAATKKLATPGLDKCDKAIELAFMHPTESTSGNLRGFELNIDIDGQTMVASYSYIGERLNAFVLIELPPDWQAVQKTESKTVNFLIESSNCTFDLCTKDPFTTGPCAEQRSR